MAAARMLQRRIGSLFLRTQQPHGHAQLFREQIVPSASSIFRKYGFEKRDIQTQSNLVDEGLANQEGGSLKLNCDSKDVPSLSNATNSSNVKFSADANLKISPRHDLAMLFTCKVCETRSLKTCSRESYEKGVVVARCAGCNNFHLMADHLGYFGAPGSVEDFLAARGEVVKKGSSDTLSLTLEDFSGKQP